MNSYQFNLRIRGTDDEFVQQPEPFEAETLEAAVFNLRQLDLEYSTVEINEAIIDEVKLKDIAPFREFCRERITGVQLRSWDACGSSVAAFEMSFSTGADLFDPSHIRHAAKNDSFDLGFIWNRILIDMGDHLWRQHIEPRADEIRRSHHNIIERHQGIWIAYYEWLKSIGLLKNGGGWE